MIYLITYFSLIIINFLGLFFNSKFKVLLYVFSSIILIYLLIFRFHVGWDWEVYDYFFSNISLVTDNNFSLKGNDFFGWEPLFVLLSSIIAIFTKNQYFVYSFFTSIALFIIVYLYLKKDSFLFIIPYTFFGYIDSFSVIRQEVALVFILFAFYYFSLEKKNKFIIFCFLAFNFHYSSIFIIILALIIYYLKLYKYIKIIILFSIVCIKYQLVFLIINNFFSYIQPLLSESISLKLNEYLTESHLNMSVGFSLRYLELLGLALIPFISRLKFNLEQDKFFLIIYIMLICNIIFYTIFNDFAIFWERFAVYCWIYESLYISFLLKDLKLFNKVTMVLFLYLIITIHHFQYWSSPERLVETNLSRFYPYKSLFEK